VQIAKLQIDRFGAWTDLALGPLTSGLNVFWGQETTDRATLVEFVRGVLFGFSDEVRDRWLPRSSRDAGGSLTLNVPSGLQTVYRHDSGDRQGRVMVEGEQGAVLSGQRLETLLSGIPQTVFDRVFIADFHQRRDIGLLIDAALAQGLPIIGGHGDVSRMAPLRVRLSEQRRLLDELTTADLSLTALLERRRSLRTDVEALEAAAQQFVERDEQKRRKLQAELVDLEQQREELEAELRQLDAEIEMRQDERQRKELEIRQAQAERQQRVVERRQRLAEIDGQLERWRHVLRDVELRRERLQADQEAGDVAEDGTADPRQHLRRLEDHVDHLQAAAGQLEEDDHVEICQCRQLRRQLASALQTMREEIYRLCNQLSLWEASARRSESSGELSQMRRCEAELRQAIQGLSLQRQRLIAELSSFQPGSPTMRLSHIDLCRCAEHPTEWETIDAESGDDCILDEELLSVLDTEIARLQQRRRNVLGDVEEVDDELRQLRQKLEHGYREDESNPHRQRLESKRRELERVERQICDGEKRRDVQAGIAELEAEIRVLEAAMRQSEILRDAAELLRCVSRNELQQISITPERTVRVQNRAGARLPWPELGPAQRDQVYLSLNLALVAAFARVGTRLPLILHDVLLRQDSPHSEEAASLLNEFAGRGHQVLLLLGSGQAAELFRSRGASVRRLPNPCEVPLTASEPIAEDLSERKRLEINRQLNAIAEEEVAEPRPVVSYPAFSAEEFPGELTDRVRANTSEEPQVDDEQGASEYFLLESSPIDEAPSIDAATAERFRKIGVLHVRDLLQIDIDDAAHRLRHAGITAGMIRSWRAEALLVCRVARLRPYDARILVACGVESPKQLAGLDADELRRRVETFASTGTGQVLIHAGNRYELSRLTNWIRAARRMDGHRHREYGEPRPASSRASREGRDRAAEQGGRRKQAFENRGRRAGRRRRERSNEYATDRVQPAGASPAKDPSSRNDRAPRAERPVHAGPANREAVVLKLDGDGADLRFYLNTSDPIESAPSIGPRTAERLERIGIHTVADFLRADPVATAERLNHRYIKAETIRQWQQQTILVCRVPQLRGHDAQILVACGIVDPETLASTDPAVLWETVEPFSETAEGKRIIRSGKTPDFAEVYSWIQWAGHARQLRAA